MNKAEFLSVAEKGHYPFKSYPRVRCDTILFPGCAFPSQFPRTMDALAEKCRMAGFGIAYDCCGDPLAGFGRQAGSERIIRNINRRLNKLGCKRLVFVCPNCLRHLTGKLDCQLMSIFDVLDELNMGHSSAFEPGNLYVPCPDLQTHVLESKLRGLCDLSNVETMTKVPCCGLRPDIASKGAEYTEKLAGIIIDKAEGGPLYTYCASCLGQFSRMGYTNCRHVVSVMLGIDEQPDSRHALINRAKRGFDRNTNPLGGPARG